MLRRRSFRRRGPRGVYLNNPWNSNFTVATATNNAPFQGFISFVTQDLGVSEATSIEQAAVQKQIYMRSGAWKVLRFQARLDFAIVIAKDDVAGGHQGIRNLLVRFGLFIGECDVLGNPINNADWDLRGNSLASDGTKTRRWLVLRQFILTNSAAGRGQVSTAGLDPVGSFLNNAYTLPTQGGVMANNADVTFGTNRKTLHIHVRPKKVIGYNQRLFGTVTAIDMQGFNADPNVQAKFAMRWDTRIVGGMAGRATRFSG